MPIGRRRKIISVSDEEEKLCFLMWVTEKTLKKAELRLRVEYSRIIPAHTLRTHAIQYAAKNPEEAREVMLEAGDSWAEDKNRFYQYIISAIHTVNARLYFELITKEPFCHYVD